MEDEGVETQEGRKRALDLMKKMINDERGFSPLMDEVFLLCFLRAKKFEVNRAFATLKNFYTYKARYSGHVTDLTPSDVAGVLETNKVYLSPRRDREGGGVIIVHLGAFDLDAASVEQYLGASICCVHSCVLQESLQLGRISVVFDYTGIGFRLIRNVFYPPFLWKVVRCIVDAIPLRIKGLHSVHDSTTIKRLFRLLIDPLLPVKLRSRVYLHGDDEEGLHKILPRECLPESLGGSLTLEDISSFKSHLMKLQLPMEKLRQYKYKGKTYPNELSSMWHHS